MYWDCLYPYSLSSLILSSQLSFVSLYAMVKGEPPPIKCTWKSLNGCWQFANSFCETVFLGCFWWGNANKWEEARFHCCFRSAMSGGNKTAVVLKFFDLFTTISSLKTLCHELGFRNYIRYGIFGGFGGCRTLQGDSCTPDTDVDKGTLFAFVCDGFLLILCCWCLTIDRLISDQSDIVWKVCNFVSMMDTVLCHCVSR